MRIVKINNKVSAANGFYGNIEKSKATIILLMYENGVYIRPNLLDTASQSDNNPFKSPIYFAFIIRFEIKITQPKVINMTTIPNRISIMIAWVKGNENKRSGNTNMLKRSFKFLYLILSIIFGKGLKYLSNAILILIKMDIIIKTINVNACVLDSEVSML